MKVIDVVDDFGGVHQALVDDGDFASLSKFNWYARSGYAWRSAKPHWLHQAVIGDVGDGSVVDHVDRNRLNCQRENLRVISKSLNTRMAGPWRIKASKFKGVTFHRRNRKWRAVLCAKKIQLFVGSFDHEHDAAVARDYAARSVYPEGGCYLNFGGNLEVPDRIRAVVDHRLRIGKLGKVESSLSRLKRENCLSEHKGVTKVGSRFRSQIKLNGVLFQLGSFSSELSAKRAYDVVNELRGEDGSIRVRSQCIIVVAGAFGSGKSWVCHRLGLDYVSFDEYKQLSKAEVVRMLTLAEGPVVVDPPIQASSWRRFEDIGCRVVLCVISESVEVICKRLQERGGIVNLKSVRKRVNAMARLKSVADVSGSAEEVLDKLRAGRFGVGRLSPREGFAKQS